MPETYEHPRKYLDTWLRQATKGLCAEAQTQVDAEISAHFADAVAAGREAGLDEDEAAYQAYLALGDSRVACANFHRVYLSAGEKEQIRKFYDGPPVFIRVLDVIYCLLVLYLLMYTKPYAGSPVEAYLKQSFIVVMLICLVSAVAQCFWRHPSLALRVYNRVAIRLSSVFVIFYPLWAKEFGLWFGILVVMIILLIDVSGVLLCYRLMRKARQHPEVLK